MKRYVLGISGCSGSGKSEILKKLSNMRSKFINSLQLNNFIKA